MNYKKEAKFIHSRNKKKFLKIASKEFLKSTKLKLFSKQTAGAGELETKDFGTAKAFKAQVGFKDGSPEKEKILQFLEDMNEARYYVGKKLKTLSESGVLEKELIKLSNHPKRINYYKIIDQFVKDEDLPQHVLKISQKYSKFNYLLGYDIEGKIKSYIALEKKSNGDKKNIFSQQVKDGWVNFSKEDMNKDINEEIVKSVCGRSLKKNPKAKDFYFWCFEKSLNETKSKLECCDFDSKGKIKFMSGVKGVKAHNILVSYINIFIGQYNGQSTNWAIEKFSTQHSQKFTSTRALHKWVATHDKTRQDALKKEFYGYSKKLLKLERIKGFPSFPSFHTVESYKNKNKFREDILDYFKDYTELKIQLNKFKFSQKNFMKHLKSFGLKEFNSESLKEAYENLQEQQNKNLFKKVELQELNLENEKIRKPFLSVGSSSLAFKKRLLRRIYKNNLDVTKALNEELNFLDKKIETFKQTLNSRGRLSVRKLKALSQAMGNFLRLSVHSKSFEKTGSNFDKMSLLEEISLVCQNLQMEGMKLKPYQRLSFQFRQYEQSKLYPSLEKKSNKDMLSLYLDIFNLNKKAVNKQKINFLKWNGSDLKYESSIAKVNSTHFLKIPVEFPKRIGRKFVFNWNIGLRENQNFVKFGAPNFIVTYKKAEAPKIEAVIALTKQKFSPSILSYKKEMLKESKADFLLKETRYLIGLDRGENKLFSYTVWDNQEKKILKRGEIGDGFKNIVDKRMKKLGILQKKFSKQSKKERNKISNVVFDFVNQAVNELIHLSLVYKDPKKTTALVLEYLDPKFKRMGRGAYVDLGQMNKLIVKLKEARNFYHLPFQIYEISAAYTSQICSQCGNIDKDSRKKEKYRCISCGHEDDADIQASENIVYKWLAKKNYEAEGFKVLNKEYFSEYIKNTKNKKSA